MKGRKQAKFLRRKGGYSARRSVRRGQARLQTAWRGVCRKRRWRKILGGTSETTAGVPTDALKSEPPGEIQGQPPTDADAGKAQLRPGQTSVKPRQTDSVQSNPPTQSDEAEQTIKSRILSILASTPHPFPE